MAMSSVLVGVDGSPESIGAATLGARLAERTGADCRLLHIAPDFWASIAAPEGGVDPVYLAAATKEQARRLVAQALEGHVPESLVAGLEVRIGRSPVVLAERAREQHADVVVLGGKRRRALARLGGSTVTHLVRLGSVPVLATDGVVRDIRRVLVAADLSFAAAATIAAAEEWAAMFGAQLRVVHAVEPLSPVPGVRSPADEDQVYRLSERAVDNAITPCLTDPDSEVVVRRGRAAAVITMEARRWQADLVIVGSHGKGWVDRLLIGSTSERLLSVLPASMLVVPVAGSAHDPAARQFSDHQPLAGTPV